MMRIAYYHMPIISGSKGGSSYTAMKLISDVMRGFYRLGLSGHPDPKSFSSYKRLSEFLTTFSASPLSVIGKLVVG
jgi:hypothetical protein